MRPFISLQNELDEPPNLDFHEGVQTLINLSNPVTRDTKKPGFWPF